MEQNKKKLLQQLGYLPQDEEQAPEFPELEVSNPEDLTSLLNEMNASQIMRNPASFEPRQPDFSLENQQPSEEMKKELLPKIRKMMGR